jgi:hypothetical protein
MKDFETQKKYLNMIAYSIQYLEKNPEHLKYWESHKVMEKTLEHYSGINKEDSNFQNGVSNLKGILMLTGAKHAVEDFTSGRLLRQLEELIN